MSVVYLGVQEERRRGRVGRPRKGEAPLSAGYRLLARLEMDEVKRPERVMALGMVMALALLVYALGEWALRRGLAEMGSSLLDGKGRPTQRPTLRWVFGLFIWVRLVELEGRPMVLNLAPHHEAAVRLLGAQRYYLLE
jgi:hypothetical protein